MMDFAHYSAKNHATKILGGGGFECGGGGEGGGVVVDWRWIVGGKVEGVGGRVTVVVEWGLAVNWQWRTSGDGG